MSRKGRKIALITAGITAAAFVVALAAWWFPVDSGDGGRQVINVSAGGNVEISPSIGGDGCVVIQGKECLVDPGSDPGDDLLDELAALPTASQAPEGPGPWLFMVHGTRDLGLYVRDGFNQGDRRLPKQPTLAENTGVYVDCRVDDGWVADSGQSSDGVWYKIRFPEVSSAGDYWIYAGYVVPVGHNGLVPFCDSKARRGQ